MNNLLPIKNHIDLCYKCECGFIHWVDSRLVKSKYFVECFCGKRLYFTPINVDVKYEPIQSKTRQRVPQDIVFNKIKHILIKQGFKVSEITPAYNRAIKNKYINFADLLKQTINFIE